MSFAAPENVQLFDYGYNQTAIKLDHFVLFCKSYFGMSYRWFNTSQLPEENGMQNFKYHQRVINQNSKTRYFIIYVDFCLWFSYACIWKK